MAPEEIVFLRLHNQLISNKAFETPATIVAWMGAMQAQDYHGAKWSIGLRLPSITDAEIEHSITGRGVVRTWPMRGTLHFVASADVRWMLRLLTPRVISGSAGRYRQLELDEKVFSKSKDLLIRALEGGKILTRQALFEVFESAAIRSGNQRGIHILQKHAMEGLICFGPHAGKQPTFVLLDEWIPEAARLQREEAMAELARRYFTSHGPAMLKDFMWWTGLNTTLAKEAIELAKPELIRIRITDDDYWYKSFTVAHISASDEAYLLPGFDEYVLGYTKRGAIIDERHLKKLTPGGGIFSPTLILNGKISGTWKRILRKKSVEIIVDPFARLTPIQRIAVELAKEKYIAFITIGEK